MGDQNIWGQKSVTRTWSGRAGHCRPGPRVTPVRSRSAGRYAIPLPSLARQLLWAPASFLYAIRAERSAPKEPKCGSGERALGRGGGGGEEW